MWEWIIDPSLCSRPNTRARSRSVGGSFSTRMAMKTRLSIPSTSSRTTLFQQSFSARDLLLLGGGIFLLFKATTELNARLEWSRRSSSPAGR
jgi:hypothetical protein